MTSFGLIGARWHVGHIQPNERGSDRSNGPEDMGWNLFAQNSRENIRLSDNVATQDMLDFYHRGVPNYQPPIECPQCEARFENEE